MMPHYRNVVLAVLITFQRMIVVTDGTIMRVCGVEPGRITLWDVRFRWG